jgi:hypothetical protein
MNESLTIAFIKVLERNARAMERVAEAQEENNRIMREDIQMIRDFDLDDMVDAATEGH